MNVELLRRVKEIILEEPEAFDMDSFAEESKYSPCGTTQCIGGTAAFIYNPVKFRKFLIENTERDNQIIEDMAAEGLDLSPKQAKRLFYTHNQDPEGWPNSFTRKFTRARTSKAKAKVAAARIEHFIKTKGAE